MSVHGEREAPWDALLVANPVVVVDRMPHASLRHRNAYFSSSDVAFHDPYRARTAWDRVRTSGVAVDGGWRIYSTGPSLYACILIQHLFGLGGAHMTGRWPLSGGHRRRLDALVFHGVLAIGLKARAVRIER
jgi:cellobiose phosphorylase